jgi:hypothetical protein
LQILLLVLHEMLPPLRRQPLVSFIMSVARLLPRLPCASKSLCPCSEMDFLASFLSLSVSGFSQLLFLCHLVRRRWVTTKQLIVEPVVVVHLFLLSAIDLLSPMPPNFASISYAEETEESTFEARYAI